jgi:single-strand DNA-binding protein
MQKVILIGNVGKDPEVKSFDNGGKIANFSVGVTERGYKTKDGKEIPEHTEWFNCVVKQSGLAGIVEQYLKKGNKVFVEGKMKTREYEKDGQKKYLTELLVDNMELLTPKGEGGSQQSQSAPAQPQAEPFKQEEQDQLPF